MTIMHDQSQLKRTAFSHTLQTSRYIRHFLNKVSRTTQNAGTLEVTHFVRYLHWGQSRLKRTAFSYTLQTNRYILHFLNKVKHCLNWTSSSLFTVSMEARKTTLPPTTYPNALFIYVLQKSWTSDSSDSDLILLLDLRYYVVKMEDSFKRLTI